VAVHGNYAFVAASIAGLQVVDISTPASPFTVGTVDTHDYAADVAILSRPPFTYALVADWNAGVVVVNVTDPQAPAIVATVPTPGVARGVSVAGDFAYVANDIAGIQVLDIANILLPVIRGGAKTPGYATDVVVSGGDLLTGGAPFAYVADGPSGLQVLPIQCGASTDVGDGPAVAISMNVKIFPNPGASRGFIRFATTRSGPVQATLHDVTGRRIRQLFGETLGAGDHTIAWDGHAGDGRALPAGVYHVRVSSVEGTLGARYVVLR
jgi:hypothetical protein